MRFDFNIRFPFLQKHARRLTKTFIIVFISFSTQKSFSQTNLLNGLIACFPYNGNALDATGFGNNTILGNAQLTSDRFDKPNSAVYFNGTNASIELNPNNFKLDYFSYSIWVKAASNPPPGRSFYLLSIGSSNGNQAIAIKNTGDVMGIVGEGYMAENEIIYVQTGALPNLESWYHVVFVKDLNDYNFYINGKLLRTVSTGNKTPYYGNNIPGARIGSKSNGQNTFFNGTIDDIHIYDRPLNPTEVKLLYEGEKPHPVKLTSSETNVCGGDKMKFEVNGASNSAKFEWSFNTVKKETYNNYTEYITEDKLAQYQLEVTVEIVDDASCFPQKPIILKDNFNIKNCTELVNLSIPNAFTPNGDGVNDTWEIPNLNNIPEANLAIFNRIGTLIFTSKGYPKAWDGTINGDKLPSDTFDYQISTSAAKVIRGSVLLVR